MRCTYVTRPAPRAIGRKAALANAGSHAPRLYFAMSPPSQPHQRLCMPASMTASAALRPGSRAAPVRASAAEAPGSAAETASTVDSATLDRIRGCLWGIFIGDALSMPVHWYYDPDRLRKDFGEITDYQAPKGKHPGSIMAVSNTGGHGRGGQSGRIIGDVINHGKHEFWGKPSVHYHQGMSAGQNTLNALCARVVMRDIAQHGGYDPSNFLQAYIDFMTTPGSHNDTYAESFHRDFFANWSKGVPPEKCSQGTEGHNTAQIGGFVMLPPVVLSCAAASSAEAQDKALRHLGLTHESRKLAGFATVYADMLHRLVAGQPAKTVLEQVALTQLRLDLPELLGARYLDRRVIHSVFGSACYIEDSFPSMLYLAYKYADDFEEGVLSNTNVGGENCHRGSALGALMGASAGESGIPPRLIEGLHDHAAIKQEIDAFVEALYGQPQ